MVTLYIQCRPLDACKVRMAELREWHTAILTHPEALNDPVRLKAPPDPETLKEDPAALGATLRISWPPLTAWTSAREPSLPWMPPMV